MPDPKAAALYTITGGPKPPTLAEAAAQLKLTETDLDSAFGVVPIDPDQNLYAVQTRDGAGGAIPDVGHDVGQDERYSGPFSNPRIAPFGPPETEES